MQLRAVTLAKEAGIPEPTFLITRPFGEKFLEQLLEQIGTVSANSAVVLDFEGIKLMDGSFADEVFGTIGVERVRKKAALPRIVIAGLNVASQDNLLYALQARLRLERGLRNLAYLILDAQGKLDLIGSCEDNVRETFNLLRRKVVLTARDVQEYFKQSKLAINAASTRLKVMYDLGLAYRSDQREAPGGQYSYQLPI